MATNRILIVDDEETLCEVLKLNLENEGYDVDTAFSAEQALGYNLKEYSLPTDGSSDSHLNSSQASG